MSKNDKEVQAAVDEVAGGGDSNATVTGAVADGSYIDDYERGEHYVYTLVDSRHGGHVNNTFYFGRGSYPTRCLQHLGEAAGIRKAIASDPDQELIVCGRMSCWRLHR